MRVIILVCAFVLSVSSVAAQSVEPMPWFGLPRGLFTPIGDNELRLVSTMPDPVKIRLAIKQDRVESNLGGISFNTERTDGSNTHDEYALIMGRLTADKQEGAVYIAVRGRDAEPVKQKLYIGPREAIFDVPVYAPNLGVISGKPECVVSPNGVFNTCQQSDGNLVQYEVVGSTWCPRWHSWGELVPKESWPEGHVCR